MTIEIKEILDQIIDEIISNIKSPPYDNELDQAFISDNSDEDRVLQSSSLDSSDIEEFFNITTTLSLTPSGYENLIDGHHEYFGDNGYNGHRIITTLES